MEEDEEARKISGDEASESAGESEARMREPEMKGKPEDELKEEQHHESKKGSSAIPTREHMTSQEAIGKARDYDISGGQFAGSW